MRNSNSFFFVEQAAKSKPYEFLKYILETECEGSLPNYLTRKNWTDDFHTYLKPNAIFSLFTIEVVLTEEGAKHLDDIIEVIFTYIRLNLQKLKECEFLERLYHDFADVKNLPLYYEKESQEVARRLARNLMYDTPEYESKDGYDADAIHEAIDTLNKRKFNVIVISSHKYDESIKFELTDGDLGMEYSERKMPIMWTSLWDDPILFPELSLPAPNPYIATDFTIIYDGSQSVPECPTKVFENDISELWFRQDDKFLTPEVCCNFYLKSPLGVSSVDK